MAWPWRIAEALQMRVGYRRQSLTGRVARGQQLAAGSLLMSDAQPQAAVALHRSNRHQCVRDKISPKARSFVLARSTCIGYTRAW